jgi:hypothetical protein
VVRIPADISLSLHRHSPDSRSLAPLTGWDNALTRFTRRVSHSCPVPVRSLAVAYAPQRVRVNAIAPSATMTDRVKKLIAGNAALTELADSHLLGLIEPHDIANMALYLASDESRMVTGQVLPVDSGVTIS